MSLSIFWINFDITFKSPISSVKLEEITGKPVAIVEGTPFGIEVDGYIREYGVTHYRKSSAIAFAKSNLYENDTFLKFIPHKVNVADLFVIEESEIQSEIYDDEDIGDSIIQDPREKGIYYHSGRCFYFEDGS